ncbi:MAG TPA: tetratricopeptide repeat protein [Isosphaeraceae bacterium]|jgi:tetratricopeptide (TPR) repeat protein|nr:tetratricopeptide repeat protein [Isosphaeraceae bacterium]
MRLLDWRRVAFDDGVLTEPNQDENRLVLWVPGEREKSFQYWERISNVARAEVTSEAGLCSTAASSIRARQKVRGVLGKLLPALEGSSKDRSWTLPNGEGAEQCGERQTDLILVWPEDDEAPLDESQLKSRLPQSKRFQKIGKNLFLVSGVEPKRSKAEPEPASLGCPRKEAERLLAEARQAGDRPKEATALTDLGIILRNEGDAQRAVMFLEQALPLVRAVEDRSRESDVLGSLGLAVLTVGHFPRKALEIFEQELTLAREAGNRYAEKLALEHLGIAQGSLRNPAAALTFYEQALVMAREIGDRLHQTNLLWQQCIQYAELGVRDAAIAKGQAAIDLMRSMGRPHAEWYENHLRRYRAGGPGASLGGTAAGPSQGSTASGPGLLRMAFTAAEAMAKFLGSGLKTSPPETARQRLETCNSCEHHTGLRCRVCGCFTNVKTRMLHEQCPIGKWQA